MEDAIQLSSWDDMCTKNGGITLIILLGIIIFYLAIRYHIFSVGSAKSIAAYTCPLYDHGKPAAKSSMFLRFMRAMERIFILPFVPAHLDSYVMWIYFWFFAITIPMGITRYYEKRWSHDTITLQGPLNVISYLLGCKSLALEAVRYSENNTGVPPRFPPPPKSVKYERIDYFFSYHLAFGVTWLTVGFIQIYKARSGGWCLDEKSNWKAHRLFGRVALLSVMFHVCMMAIMTYENPVNQHPIILFGYSGMIYRSLTNIRQGIKNAMKAVRSTDEKEKHNYIKKHKMYMFMVYARTTMGSGTIRIAAWALWFIGHFMP
jgi:hypothetical protein